MGDAPSASGPAHPGPNVLMLSVSGCRGIFGVTMTPEVAARFALASAGFLREQRARAGVAGRPLVVLGRDGRAGGESLLLA
ncbi:MAG TPA: hypothetical protein PL072_03310, partial [Phycisphaerales bacterium]|nr:hypothetical protein [Phycisphaerales bacterium]